MEGGQVAHLESAGLCVSWFLWMIQVMYNIMHWNTEFEDHW